MTVIGAIGDREHIARSSSRARRASTASSRSSSPTSSPRRSSARRAHRCSRSAARKIGGEHFALIAGPCTVESRDQTLTTARVVKRRRRDDAPRRRLQAAHVALRLPGPGRRRACGCWPRPRSATGLPIVTELMDARDLEPVLEVADVIQIGARNMQNYALLAEIGRSGCPALIKRGLSAHARGAADGRRVRPQGGQRARHPLRARHPHVRDRLPLHARPHRGPGAQGALAPAVVVDPSHAAGRRDLVEPLSLAAAAAGADGIIVEVHPEPEEAICDGPQQLRADDFAELRRPGRAGRRRRRQGVPAPRTHAADATAVIVAVVGVGLIGGSVGLAARRRLGAHVRGVGPEAARARSRAARSTRPAPTSPTALAGADAAFVAVPVDALADDGRAVLPPRRRAAS